MLRNLLGVAVLGRLLMKMDDRVDDVWKTCPALAHLLIVIIEGCMASDISWRCGSCASFRDIVIFEVFYFMFFKIVLIFFSFFFVFVFCFPIGVSVFSCTRNLTQAYRL